jgi:hypothetical protein
VGRHGRRCQGPEAYIRGIRTNETNPDRFRYGAYHFVAILVAAGSIEKFCFDSGQGYVFDTSRIGRRLS